MDIINVTYAVQYQIFCTIFLIKINIIAIEIVKCFQKKNVCFLSKKWDLCCTSLQQKENLYMQSSKVLLVKLLYKNLNLIMFLILTIRNFDKIYLSNLKLIMLRHFNNVTWANLQNKSNLFYVRRSATPPFLKTW